MRTKFVYDINEIVTPDDKAQYEEGAMDAVESKDEVFDICPWAAVVLERDGGWRAYESAEDAEIAESQN